MFASFCNTPDGMWRLDATLRLLRGGRFVGHTSDTFGHTIVPFSTSPIFVTSRDPPSGQPYQVLLPAMRK
ncbi:hypothetical protein DQ04_22621000 [Trypanosoma grayi]|uniref:hypothetical protein n=1 Tax=Trypanosoma grayi TaxID=71804 RepID=UPI0004F48485|nr:hypothetical protein DQ04_22621000 [Trypanosoma grayi]KEG05384.1 hypothetical protein DQ04_22621000 [Trypanosoma grayi]